MKLRQSALNWFVGLYIVTDAVLFWQGQTRLAWTLFIIFITWTSMDGISHLVTGKTMSKKWVAWKSTHPVAAWTTAGLILAMILALLVHLMA